MLDSLTVCGVQHDPMSKPKKPPLPLTDPRHGTVNGYVNLGCRCAVCGYAWKGYHAKYVARHPEVNERKRIKAAETYRRRVLMSGVPQFTSTRERNEHYAIRDLAEHMLVTGRPPTWNEAVKITGRGRTTLESYFNGSIETLVRKCGFAMVLVPMDIDPL